jgi:hypothetical protein
MKSSVLVLLLLLNSAVAFSQTEGARISGRVTDQTGAVIAEAECKITDIETNVSTVTTSNQDGIYVIPDLRPATYRLTIQKEGFRTIVRPSLQLYVQDAVNRSGPVFGRQASPGSSPLPLLGSSTADHP